jgi:preprotein translocase subunit SecA
MASARTNTLPMPGLLWGTYPERKVQKHEELARRWSSRLSLPDTLMIGRYRGFARAVEAHRHSLAAEHDETLVVRLRALAPMLGRHGLQDDTLAQACAVVALFCHRRLGLAPFETQIMAARAMLDNRLVEMATGEGKTLAVAMAASLGALAGMPVHVITANDYLVERDSEQLHPLYATLGLRVGGITSRHEPEARRAAHACDIVYCTAKEIGFDYLRDRVAGRRRGDDLRRRVDRLAGRAGHATLLRGLCMAIIDEADSILIDEARVPLILSRPANDDRRHRHECADYGQALKLARQLAAGSDFEVDLEAGHAELTDAGRRRLDEAAAALPEGSEWRHGRYREEWVRQALNALHAFRRDRDYIVRDGHVEIVDATTGRVAVGRSWSRGLHQLIELKEGCEATPDHVVAAQITFQRLFRRYHRLAGVSGTLRESAVELRRIYGLGVFRLPLRLPLRRQVLPTRFFPDRQSLWSAVAARIAELRAAGRPVLVGTDSVGDSEALAKRLSLAGIPCNILNARQDKEEADIVAQAGQRAKVTVTTNMAGRGTDIPIEPAVEALGGLHVISCQHNAARRIDRQLVGRCARQGGPGSVETMLSLESDLFMKHWPQTWLDALKPALESRPWRHAALLLAKLAQRQEEARGAAERRRLLHNDEQIERQLAFGGQTE